MKYVCLRCDSESPCYLDAAEADPDNKPVFCPFDAGIKPKWRIDGD